MNKQDGVRSGSDREKTPSRMATFKCTLVQTFCTVCLNYFNSQADGKKVHQSMCTLVQTFRTANPIHKRWRKCMVVHARAWNTTWCNIFLPFAHVGKLTLYLGWCRNHGTRCLQFAWWYKPSIHIHFTSGKRVLHSIHKRNGKKVRYSMCMLVQTFCTANSIHKRWENVWWSTPEHEIPLGTIFSFLLCMLASKAHDGWLVQKSRHLLPSICMVVQTFRTYPFHKRKKGTSFNSQAEWKKGMPFNVHTSTNLPYS